MRKILVLLLTLGVLLGACESDDMEMPADAGTSGTVFKLGRDPFENMSTRSANEEKARYDRLEYYILDESGKPVEGVKSLYRAESSEIVVEGLHEGDYSLLVLGIVGDYERDGVVINTLSDISDVWLTFPENMNTSLCAEYYYSRTPFSVIRHQTADGMIEMVSVDTEIHQKRIMGRMDYSLGYSNDYVRTAMVSRKVNLVSPKFYTQFTADSVFSGQTSGQDMTFDLDESESLFFMPSLSSFEGTVDLISRDYKGGRTEQVYHFDGAELEPNKINDVKVAVRHPDDDSGLMFVTDKAYLEGKHGKILQDGEPVSVYTDARQRSFSTMNLLQTSITDEGQLHLRFYSPRSIEGVTVKARIPAISDEYVDFAYFDTIPDELLESARMDGASTPRIWIEFMVPLSVPIIANVLVLTFIYAWNGYLVPLLVMRSEENYTVTLAAQYFMSSTYQSGRCGKNLCSYDAADSSIYSGISFQPEISCIRYNCGICKRIIDTSKN